MQNNFIMGLLLNRAQLLLLNLENKEIKRGIKGGSSRPFCYLCIPYCHVEVDMYRFTKSKVLVYKWVQLKMFTRFLFNEKTHSCLLHRPINTSLKIKSIFSYGQ